MDSKKIRKLQLLQLMMLKQILTIITSNNLRYFLLCGTMLGASRHGGFIPWDDDLDIGLPREDYEHLLTVLNTKIPQNLFLQNIITDKYCPVLFTKIRLRETKFIEKDIENTKSNHKEIFIDIFPIDGCGLKKEKARKHAKKLILLRKMYNNSIYSSKFRTSGFFRRIKQMFFRVISLFISKKIILRSFVKTTQKYNFNDSNYVANAHTKISEFMEKKVYYDSNTNNEIRFEDIVVKSVSYPDEYLTNIYGDWETLPPIDKRGNWHNAVSIDFGDY